MKRGGRLPAKSKKTAERDVEYMRLREPFLRAHPRCQIGWDRNCTTWSTEVHHKLGRAVRPELMLDQTHWVAGCHYCHTRVTREPKEARRRGHLLRSTDLPLDRRSKIGLLTDL